MSGSFARDLLNPIFNGIQDTIIIGLREARVKEGFRYVAALSTKDNGAIVLNLDAEELMEFRKRIGFGILLNRVTDNEGIVYTALEDSSGLLAASSNVSNLDNIYESQFLSESMQENKFKWRFTNFDGSELFEAVHPFEQDGRYIGLFRIGLSLDPLNAVYDRITTRIISSAVLLLVLGTLLLAFVFARQNFNLLSRKYEYIESFSNKLIKHANDIIIVVNEQKTIININPAGRKFFNLTNESNLTLSLDRLLCEEAEAKIFNTDSNIIETTCNTESGKKQLLISRSKFRDSEDRLNYVLIMKDLTNLKELEAQVERSKQLTAMGHLASGVAHEIRNPLNAIGTIVQQLKMDFEPVNDKEDYERFTSLIYKEVKRINKTIESFLKLARPEPINRETFSLNELFEELSVQYNRSLEEKNISFIVNSEFNGIVNWDRDQIKQVFINLISNAKDAINNGGNIELSCFEFEEEVVIKILDNGEGISEENLNKIFNLYFTTKASGTGVGLGIVQRIINEHGGLISVDSTPKVGTVFTIKMKP